MERMQSEMDRLFDEASKQFKLKPSFRGFYDEPRFGSAMDLQEKDDSDVVRAYLPERNMKNVNVMLDDETLRIEAKEQKNEQNKGDTGVFFSSLQYF